MGLQNYNHLQKEETTAFLKKMLKLNHILQLFLEMFIFQLSNLEPVTTNCRLKPADGTMFLLMRESLLFAAKMIEVMIFIIY